MSSSLTACRPARVLPSAALADHTLVPLPLITAAAASPRAELPDVDALAENIRQIGLVQPVALRRTSGGYEVLAGHRRLAAYRRLHQWNPTDPQWTAIPAVVSRVDDEQALLMLVSAQATIKPWSPAEEAAVLRHLVDMGLTLAAIGIALHHTESWASRRVRVYRDNVLSEPVRAGQLDVGVAEELLGVRSRARRHALASRAVAERWSQQQARTEADPTRAIRVRARWLAKALGGVDLAEIDRTTLAELQALARMIEERFAPTRAGTRAA